MSNQVQATIDILKQARNEIDISFTDPDLRFLKQRVLMDLDKINNQLALRSGIDMLKEHSAPQQSAPLKTFMGRRIAAKHPGSTLNENELPDLTKRIKPKSAFEMAAMELKETAEVLLEHIPTMEADDVLDKYSDLEVRAVAKLAGLPVTETDPKRITTDYIQQIKDAIKKKFEPILGLPDSHQPAHIQAPAEDENITRQPIVEPEIKSEKPTQKITPTQQQAKK